MAVRPPRAREAAASPPRVTAASPPRERCAIRLIWESECPATLLPCDPALTLPPCYPALTLLPCCPGSAIRLIKEERDKAKAVGGEKVTPVIISCTGHATVHSHAVSIIESGADAVWSKPFPDYVDQTMQSEVARLLLAAKSGIDKAMINVLPLSSGAMSYHAKAAADKQLTRRSSSPAALARPRPPQ